MGLFGARRVAPKETPKGKVLTSSKASSALLATLFADDEPSNEDDFINNSQQSNASLAKSLEYMDINATPSRSNSNQPSPMNQDDLNRPSQDRNSTSRKGNRDNGNRDNSKESMSQVARRDSIKRSLSRKLARSESRRQLLNMKDEHSNLQSGEHGHPSSTTVTPNSIHGPDHQNYSTNPLGPTLLENKVAQVTMSPVTPATTGGIAHDDRTNCNNGEMLQEKESRKYDKGDSLSPKNDVMLNKDVMSVMEPEDGDKIPAIDDWSGDPDDVPPMSEPSSTLALTLEAATFALPNADNGPMLPPSSDSVRSKTRSRRRPPPLVGTQGKAIDSTADWPSGAVFGSDGGFMTGGFHITAEGMVDRPDLQTRQDSDPEADGDGPRTAELEAEATVTVCTLKEFRNGPTIGSGAAGRVYIAEHLPSKTTMAVKTVNVYNKEKRNQLMKELETLCTYVSRYLVRFHGAFYDGSGAVHIALEYMDHGCLSTFVQRVGAIPERIVQMIAQDCLRGLRFLHRHHVLHRDFKTANILLSRKLCRAKLSDFGLARDLHPGVSKVDTFVGTVAYMSPERLQGGKYTYASDVWALGVSLIECLIGRHPFNRPQNYFDYIEATVASSTLQGFDKEGRFSENVMDFISQCTYTDPKRRPQAVDLLEHPWIKGIQRNTEEFGAWLDEARTISVQVSSRKITT